MNQASKIHYSRNFKTDAENDILEKQSLNDDELSEEQKNIKVKLAAELVTFPSLPKTSLVKEQNK